MLLKKTLLLVSFAQGELVSHPFYIVFTVYICVCLADSLETAGKIEPKDESPCAHCRWFLGLSGSRWLSSSMTSMWWPSLPSWSRRFMPYSSNCRSPMLYGFGCWLKYAGVLPKVPNPGWKGGYLGLLGVRPMLA